MIALVARSCTLGRRTRRPSRLRSRLSTARRLTGPICCPARHAGS